MREMRVGEFDIRHTVESGQPLTFFGDIRDDGKGVTYTYKDNFVQVEQNGESLAYGAYRDIGSQKLKREIISRFGLKDNLRRIYRSISTDPFMKRAIRDCRGMRITRNDPWETTLCYVVSQRNNFKRIRGIVKKLIAAYGDAHTVSVGSVDFSFRSIPTPEALARKSVEELKKHGAGFRARYIKSVAQECNDSFDLERLGKKDYESAKEELMSLDGVGDKVSDCILLFGYGRLEAFPVDTWIKRIVEYVYFHGKKRSVRQIHEFAEEKWGPMAGYAQQYLFHQGRSMKIGKVKGNDLREG